MGKLREQLADQEHERWSSWMKYLFSKCEPMGGGDLLIPHESVKHWLRQVETPYSKLSEKEKDSDRKEADNTLKLLYHHEKVVAAVLEYVNSCDSEGGDGDYQFFVELKEALWELRARER